MDVSIKADNIEKNKITISMLEHFFKIMLKIRMVEEKLAELIYKKEISCPVHLCVGQEAIATGVSLNLRDDDFVFSTHRNHGHFIAEGGELNELFAEIYGKNTGCSRGKGGSMHVIAPEIGFMGSAAIVSGSIPIAVGAAFTAKKNGNGQVAVAFFGDGATEEGVFYESINFAALYKLPVIFVCENNLFATHMPIFLRQSNVKIYEKVAVHNVNSKRIDGNNVIDVYNTIKKMIDNARIGGGPSFCECMTFRWLAHVGPTPDLDIGYRRKKDVEFWKERCPIELVKELIKERKNYNLARLDRIRDNIQKEIDNAYDFALKSKYPDNQDLHKHVFHDERRS